MKVGLVAAIVVLAVGTLQADALLCEGYQYMYNLRFDQAHRTFFKEYQWARPTDPPGSVSDAASYLQAQDPNALFASTLRHGLRADHLALIEKRNLAALAEGRQAAEQLLALDPKYYDAYLAIGVENYLLSMKPTPVRWFLHLNGVKTDKQADIENLHLTAEHGRYLLPYARLLLAVAALRERNKSHARQFLARLARQFPDNSLYRGELAKISM